MSPVSDNCLARNMARVVLPLPATPFMRMGLLGGSVSIRLCSPVRLNARVETSGAAGEVENTGVEGGFPVGFIRYAA